MVLRLLAVRRPQNRVRHVKKQVGRQSLMHFGAKNDGFMINLRFDLGEKSRGVVKPLFSPMPKGDALAQGVLGGAKHCVVVRTSFLRFSNIGQEMRKRRIKEVPNIGIKTKMKPTVSKHEK